MMRALKEKMKVNENKRCELELNLSFKSVNTTI